MPATDTVTFEAAWQQWHQERESYFADPLGWVSLTGLYWLTDEFETVADLPGRWRADADAVYVEGCRVRNGWNRWRVHPGCSSKTGRDVSR